MFKYVIGDILKSSSDCIVNTVNCEGYMGKGIAYQFKLKFPENNESYKNACRNKSLTIGKLHCYVENNKTIINFPTKDKWRQKSKYEYIEKGMVELVNLLPKLDIHSIAIPPLGCGNGGLLWENVKKIILDSLKPLANDYEFVLYEPSKNSQFYMKI